MDAHTQVEEWEVSPFDGGFEGLRDLRTRGFSGAAEVGETALFLRDGEPIAVVEDLGDDPIPGDVDAFDGAAGDLHEAGRPQTATLAAMLALDGDVRGQYFTEDTPLSTVHETLSEGGFTGYVELSENVLSGDYYVVYRDGRAEHVAFVGSGNRVLVDEEAREKAAGEVGIYSVVGVSLPDLDVPEPERFGSGPSVGGARTGGSRAGGSADRESPADGAATGETSADVATVEADDTTDTTTADGSDTATADASDATAVDSGTGGGTAERAGRGGTEPQAASESTAADASETVAEEGDATSGTVEAVASEPADEPDSTSDTDAGTTPDTTGGVGSEGSAESNTDPRSGPRSVDDRAPDGTGPGWGAAPAGTGTEDGVVDAVSSRTVPSLDPQNSREGRGDAGDASSLPVGAGSEPESAPVPEPPSTADEGTSTSTDTAGGPGGSRDTDTGPDVGQRVEAVRREYEDRIEELRIEREELRAERDDLRGRIESLQSGGADPPDGRVDAGGSTGEAGSLSAAAAIAGTSLFVREGTRGGATLEDALDGGTDRETLAENVRVEYHTEFDDGGATVEGRPFEEWLHGTAHYRFVRWAVVDLLFEIRSTGSASSMRHLYDALPEIDRVGLRDAVVVGTDGERREITFDLVARDQMGDPLLVANIDESRDPTSGEVMAPLVTDASDVCERHETLAAAFAVTSSYFEPAALDTVREATSGSLLGRDRYRSYVKIARKNGFHVCTVERRDGDFHLTVPEL